MADITAGYSIPSHRKFLEIQKADGTMANISAYITDVGETLPMNIVSDRPGNEFWDKPLTASGGMRTVNVPVRKTPEIEDILEDLIDAQAVTGTPQEWDYNYGYDSNDSGKPKTSGEFVLGTVSWNAPIDGKQDGSFEMQLRSRNRSTF